MYIDEAIDRAIVRGIDILQPYEPSLTYESLQSECDNDGLWMLDGVCYLLEQHHIMPDEEFLALLEESDPHDPYLRGWRGTDVAVKN